MTNLEAADHADIFVPHVSFDVYTVDLGEIRMNYVVAGELQNPAVLLIPAQTSGTHTIPRRIAGPGRARFVPGATHLDRAGSNSFTHTPQGV